MAENWFLLLSCEHAGNRVPPSYASLFQGREDLLASHCGYDIGILPLARGLAEKLEVPLLSCETTRLLVDMNRSASNRRKLFSEFTRGLPAVERQRIVETWHAPHWDKVRSRIASLLATYPGVLHLALHSFTPELHGHRRNADFGLLYDPQRSRERRFCLAWKEKMEHLDDRLRVRRNYPYPGVMDGMTAALRKVFSAECYAGVELEVNQELLDDRNGPPPALFSLILESLRGTCDEFGALPEEEEEGG